MKLAYQAFDGAGHVVEDVIEAEGVRDATEKLRQSGLYITQIRERRGKGSRSGGLQLRRMRLGAKQRLRCLVMFSKQLHMLLATGTPLVQALTALENQSADADWSGVLADIREKVESGASLAEALQSHPQYFDEIFTSVVEAGEASGNLSEMCERMALLSERQLQLRRSVGGAMVYPALLAGIGVATVLVMLVAVLPKFEDMFESLGAPLPPTTAALMFLSHVIRSYWWVVTPVTLGIIGGVVWWLRTPGGKRVLNDVILRAPKIGPITRELLTARLVRLLGTLLDSYVPVLDALALTRKSTGNQRYATLLGNAESAVSRGETMSTAFEHSNLVNPTVVEALRNGEQTGKIGSTLSQVADFLDEENEVVVKSLTSVLEPLVLVFIGIVVGFVAVSMYLPLFDLSAMQH
ncbi:MAG: hypothetical protein CMJ49_08595 [Planctomycetaceae bacterium]|nr:hypothetical protein [Planctomycetaceae bacterium]